MKAIIPLSPPSYKQGNLPGNVKDLCAYARNLQEQVDFYLGQFQKACADANTAMEQIQKGVESINALYNYSEETKTLNIIPATSFNKDITTIGKATLGSASIGGNDVAAVVVETNNGYATNDNSWAYRKYSDGTCDLWAFKYIDMSCTTALGSWYRSNTISIQALPFTMASTTFTYGFEMDTSKNSGCLLWNIAPVNGTTGPKFYAIRPTSGQAVGYIDVHIWGRWK